MNTGSSRLHSLDALRGITIAAMILVNNAGDWDHVYAPLRHARWHGLTPADLIFPFFLFIMGAAIPLSFGKIAADDSMKPGLAAKIIRRFAIIFTLGLLLNLVPDFDFTAMRIPGVLQRVALCYLFTSILFISSSSRALVLWTLLLMAAHSLTLLLVPAPGFGSATLDPRGNIAWFIDASLLRGHTYRHAIVPGFDPEGILGTVTATASTLSGTLVALLMRRANGESQKALSLFITGVLCISGGLIVNAWIPVNKNLWTASYVLVTSGIGCLGLLACYGVADLWGHRASIMPFLVLGSNSIAVYFLSSLTARLLVGIKLPASAGGSASLKSIIYAHCFSSWLGPFNASLGYSLAYLAIWLGIAYALYRNRIFIKA